MSRKYYSSKEKAGFIKEYESTGGSKVAFARAKGISKHTFSKWCSDLQKSNKVVTTPEFVPVKVVSAADKRQNQLFQNSSNIEIKLFENISLKFTTETDISYILKLIEGLR